MAKELDVGKAHEKSDTWPAFLTLCKTKLLLGALHPYGLSSLDINIAHTKAGTFY